MSSTLAKGRLSHAFSATQGDFSKIPPNFWTKAARSMLLTMFMSGSADAGKTAKNNITLAARLKAALRAQAGIWFLL
jgi:hypothetical protein